MSPTATHSSTRRAYRREIRDAQAMGVAPEQIGLVVDAFRGEHPDPDDFHVALMQYVPAITYLEDGGKPS